MSSPVRIGIVGAGAIVSQRHLPGLVRIPGVEIHAVCNRTPGSARQVAQAYGIPKIYEDWHHLVTDPDLDAVLIGTPPLLHADISVAALHAGKHVFCQARMATDLPSAVRMLAAARRHPELVNMLCPPPNAMRHGRHFTRMLADNVIGRLLHFRLVVLGQQWSDPTTEAHWRQRDELSGQNIMSLGIYAEVLRRFLGQPLALCAQARVVHPVRHGYEVRVPDLLNIIGDWPGNIAGSLEFSGVSLFGPKEELVLYGTDGTLAYDFKTDQITCGRKGETSLEPVSVPPENISEWQVEHDFISAIHNRLQPEPSFATGVEYMRVVDAVHRSLRDRAWALLET
jgi:predicted dehydrogenase